MAWPVGRGCCRASAEKPHPSRRPGKMASFGKKSFVRSRRREEAEFPI
jgi:hypothetical protein